MRDDLSREHYEIVRTEIMGRFFSFEEAISLKEAIDARTITDADTREAAAECWTEDEPITRKGPHRA